VTQYTAAMVGKRKRDSDFAMTVFEQDKTVAIMEELQRGGRASIVARQVEAASITVRKVYTRENVD
jgi:uncharacterized protein YhbP (UPF0306 family)